VTGRAPVPEEPDDLQALLRDLDDDDDAVRAGAARQIGERRSPRALPKLIRLLDDERAGVQTAAAAALGRIGDSSAIAPLLGFAQDGSRDPWARRVAVRSLEELGYRRAGEDREPSLVLWAVGLGLIGGAIAFAAWLGPVAIVPFLAGLALIALYWFRLMRRSRGLAYWPSDVGGAGDAGSGDWGNVGVGGGGNGGGGP
jgi:hypothetical protein